MTDAERSSCIADILSDRTSALMNISRAVYSRVGRLEIGLMGTPLASEEVRDFPMPEGLLLETAERITLSLDCLRNALEILDRFGDEGLFNDNATSAQEEAPVRLLEEEEQLHRQQDACGLSQRRQNNVSEELVEQRVEG